MPEMVKSFVPSRWVRRTPTSARPSPLRAAICSFARTANSTASGSKPANRVRRRKKHVDPDVIARVAERKIQEAIDEGAFDNLPGKGKPLVFDDDPMTPPHLRLANRILRNANVLPE